jgi:hypothetical protein
MHLIMDTHNANQEAGAKRKGVHAGEDSPPHQKTARRSSEPSSVEDGGLPGNDDNKLEEKRAYNRRNAARARQRTKEHILELTARAERYAAKNGELQKANNGLVADVKTLTEENQRLRQLVNMSRTPGAAAASSAAAAQGNASAGGMHGSGLPGASLMDQASLHPPSSLFFQNPEASPASASHSGGGDAAAAARQRGLIMQILQGQQSDPRQGLPAGYNF